MKEDFILLLGGGIAMKRLLAILLPIYAMAYTVQAQDSRPVVDYAVVYQVNLEPELSIIVKLFNQQDKKIRIELKHPIGDVIEEHIIIMRLDKELMWELNPKEKTYIEKIMPINESFLDISKLTRNGVKIGEEMILGHNCEVFQYKSHNNLTDWVAKHFNILLKREQTQNGYKSIMEAKEIRLEPQDDALFEIPKDYVQQWE